MTSHSVTPLVKTQAGKCLKSNPPHQPLRKTRVAQLIGKRCMVSCLVNGVPHQMLLDSGAQVTLVGRAWIEEALPDVLIQPLETLLDKEPLEIAAANGTEVPFDGWAEIELQLGGTSQGQLTIKVPALISQNCTCSLLGSNVITELIQENAEQGDQQDVMTILKQALSISGGAVEALVALLGVMAPKETFSQYSVKVGKKGITIPAGQTCKIKCRVRGFPGGGTLLFEPSTTSNCPDGLELFPALVDVPKGSSKCTKIPIQNLTKHDIYLTQRTVLGTLEEVSEVKTVKNLPERSASMPSSTIFLSVDYRQPD